jgi:hypothetical protein
MCPEKVGRMMETVIPAGTPAFPTPVVVAFTRSPEG